MYIIIFDIQYCLILNIAHNDFSYLYLYFLKSDKFMIIIHK